MASYCRYYSTGIFLQEGTAIADLPTELHAFCDAVTASNAVCAIVGDWPSYLVHRASPLLSYTLWAPAAIQLMIKAFATSNWELREKASLSLQVLTQAMKQFAEYSGIAESLLGNSYAILIHKFSRDLVDLTPALSIVSQV